ncbi:inter-alpha-trypsin inhibitor heavy chain H1-like [Dendropsophus ebraccatus]|uniref:inter-alpha-trypsin inhibitor heavy chain H1-like n=1 Tax=Dendropsophus ebraccatus TaxID=150705 RepID=UPI0038314457
MSIMITPCETFHVLGNLNERYRICVRITEAQNVIVNLFHDELTGVTVNGKLSEDGNSLVTFGLENTKTYLKVEINAENITVIQDEQATVYDWMAAIESQGILKTKSNQITFPLDVGANVTIMLSGKSLHQSFSIDSQYSAVNRTIGIIGMT